MKIYRMTHLD